MAKSRILAFALALMLCGVGVEEALAEKTEVTLARGFGVGFLPLILMERNKLLEKHAKIAGSGEVRTNWVQYASGSFMNDGVLAGKLDFATAGVTPVLTLWSKTRATAQEVRAICAMNAMPDYLNTRNPSIKSIGDFSDKDKIALPAVKVSIQAVMLQMAAAQVFGANHFNRLDKFTVSMDSPSAMAALLSGGTEITAHLTPPPFSHLELEKPGIHRVLKSYDVLGGPATLNVIYTTSKFRNENPKLYGAFLAAFQESIDLISRDVQAAAAVYLDSAKSKEPLDTIVKILQDPDIKFTMTPQNTMKYADFMHSVGLIQTKPQSWKDLFFPEIHDLPGS